MLWQNVAPTCRATPASDEHPMLYADSVIFFFEHEVPAVTNVHGQAWTKNFLLIFGEGKDRVHNVIAVGNVDCSSNDYQCSGGEQNLPDDHRFVFQQLQSEMEGLLGRL